MQLLNLRKQILTGVKKNCNVCSTTKSRLVNDQEVKGLLPSLYIKTFRYYCKMHLKQAGFPYGACSIYQHSGKSVRYKCRTNYQYI